MNERRTNGLGKSLFFLSAFAFIAYFVWFFIVPIATAARDSLVNRAATIGVPQQQQPAQGWAIATPTLAQFAPVQPATVATAVPVFGGVVEPAPVIVAATAVPPRADVAAAAAVGMLRIEAAGKAYELTGERLVDCINAQENGQRTGPTCPPNAKQYAGMLGQGR
jgi:hypothetical protein